MGDRRHLKEPLTRRRKIALLLGSLQDACGESGSSIRDKLAANPTGSRSLSFGDLYHAGSYADLLRQLDAMQRRAPSVYWHTVERYVLRSSSPVIRRRKAELGLDFLVQRMPKSLYVPEEVSHAAGIYSLAEIKAAMKPRERAVA